MLREIRHKTTRRRGRKMKYEESQLNNLVIRPIDIEAQGGSERVRRLFVGAVGLVGLIAVILFRLSDQQQPQVTLSPPPPPPPPSRIAPPPPTLQAQASAFQQLPSRNFLNPQQQLAAYQAAQWPQAANMRLPQAPSMLQAPRFPSLAEPTSSAGQQQIEVASSSGRTQPTVEDVQKVEVRGSQEVPRGVGREGEEKR
eukprot:759443-Hanusia_phi.AAC.3